MKIISLGCDIEQRSLNFSALTHFCVSIGQTFSLSPTGLARENQILRHLEPHYSRVISSFSARSTNLR